MRTFIGLGSNIDQPLGHVGDALLQLASLPSTRLVAGSSFYASKPVGPRNQPDYINAVAELDTALAPLVLLAHLQRIEHRHGRVRIQRWGRRTLDLDVLLFGKRIINHPRLRVPHPCMHLRTFVLAPLSELDPEVLVPEKGKAGMLLDRLQRGHEPTVHKLMPPTGSRN